MIVQSETDPDILRAQQFAAIWNAAKSLCADDRVEALLLLADAMALGLSEGEYEPAAILDRVEESFEGFLSDKQSGRPH